MVDLLLALMVLPVAVPAFALLALTCAGLRPVQRASSFARASGPRPRVAVLVPAHNESQHVLPTIACLKAQLSGTDRLLVVADNCTDDTADLARRAGAEVVERFDAKQRGKGFALACGVEHLRADPPDLVLVVDADCVLSAGAVALIAQECHDWGRPVQMVDLMNAPLGAGLRHRALAFAMVMKNLVRPLGSDRLGSVCQLMGTGMALPWSLAASANLASGHLAEDMKLGVELTLAGRAPRFLATAKVSSNFTLDSVAVRQQKTRWEHGHLDTMREYLPRMVRKAWVHRSRAVAVLAMDVMIPPLALYLAALIAATALLIGAGVYWPAAFGAATLCAIALAALVLAVLLAWWHFGRHLISASELVRLPFHALGKLPIYLAYARGAHSAWVRTQRPSASPTDADTGAKRS
jgi:glycosyltransferase involved in cell wall biosynthesis